MLTDLQQRLLKWRLDLIADVWGGEVVFIAVDGQWIVEDKIGDVGIISDPNLKSFDAEMLNFWDEYADEGKVPF